MNGSIPLNPWLAGAIKKLRATHTDAELKDMYRSLAEARPGTSWSDFLKETAFTEELSENPFLDRDISGTGLTEHTVDILRINHIDKVGHIMQWSLEELFRMKGLSKYELNAILDLLSEGGLVIEAEGYTLKQESFRQIAERKPAKDALEKAEEDIRAVKDDLSLSFVERAHRISAIYEEAAVRLHSARADKEMLREVFMKHADYLMGEIPYSPDLGEVAVRAGERNVRLAEYLYRPGSPDAVEAWKLLAYVLVASERYSEAIEYFKKALDTLEETPGTEQEEIIGLVYFIGICYLKIDKYDEALEYLTKAYSFYLKDEVTHRKDLRSVCYTLAELYFETGNHEKWKEFDEKFWLYSDDS